MKSKQSQLTHLGDVLQKLKSGLYLVDTELDENKIMYLSKGKSAILLLYGEVDLCSFKHEELAKLNYAVTHHGIKTIVLSKLKDTSNKVCFVTNSSRR